MLCNSGASKDGCRSEELKMGKYALVDKGALFCPSSVPTGRQQEGKSL